MIGVPGTAHRLFGALRDESISVILISQGSSEHSICFAIPEAQATRAEDVVRRAFDSELRQGQIQRVEVSRGSSILAVVGDGMAGSHGVARAGVRQRSARPASMCARSRRARRSAISPPSSTGAIRRARVRAVHAGFYLSPHTCRSASSGRAPSAASCIDQLAGRERAPAARLQSRSARARHR